MDAAHDIDVIDSLDSCTPPPAPPPAVSKPDFDRRLLEVAGAQHYVVARDQLTEFGTRRQIEHRLAKHRLERVHEGVYRVPGSPDTWHQKLTEPTPQHRVDLTATRWARLDFAWPEAKVYCEFDSYKWHGGRDKYMRDTNRRLQLAKRGWFGVAVTDDELDSGALLATQLLSQRLARPADPAPG